MDFGRVKAVQQKHTQALLPVKTGMLLEIYENIGEAGEASRTWKFKWLVIKVHNPQHTDGTFTVRGECSGVTVEKIYPMSFGKFKKVLLLDDYKTRKSKLYYIREKVGKDARFKSKIDQKRKNIDLVAEAKKGE